MRTKLAFLAILLTGALLLPFQPAMAADNLADLNIDVSYQKFILTNGLTLIVHEDHKAPIVAVNLWYHVGSKNEQPGKTGFAHLFEHLMFTGSEHFKSGGDQRTFFEAMERMGATDVNGTTDPDRTDFFENVPKNALDEALWIESDRMGHLLGSIDQNRLDTQRGVVQNEKRQNENQPYGKVWELIAKGTAPVGHPYSWTTIGSMEDLNAASLDDVKNWFRTYYGAANVVLTIAGDIDPETARKKVEFYFGEIPSGPPVARFKEWIPHVSGKRREIVSDRVPQARFYKVWNIPSYGDAENVWLDMVGDILASGKTSRLYKRLVYDDQLATDVSAYVDAGEISGQFTIVATAKPGGDLSKIEAAADEEVARFLEDGPTSKELERVKAGEFATFIRGIERIGGFGGKSDLLAMNETFRGSPDFYKTVLNYRREATTTDLRNAARKWLGDDVYLLEVHPFPDYETTVSTVDRSAPPVPGAAPEVKFPAFQRAKLSNGLKVVLAERHSIPLVNFDLQVDAGYAADQFATPGTAKLAMNMLDEGTATRTALQISDELASLGASLSAGSDLDTSSVGLTALTPALDRALNLYADVILNPSFPEADFARLQKQMIAGIQLEKTEPGSMAQRVLPGILYGHDHAYGNPLTGSGNEESVGKLQRTDLQKFHDTWFKPNNATLIIVGDTTLQEIMPKLEKLFSHWKPGEIPAKNIGPVEQKQESVVYLIDRPGSIQSMIFVGEIAPPRANPDEITIETMKDILGGTFTSRVNLNLRENKHWSYGVRTVLYPAKGPRPLFTYAPVQTDKTKESMIELDKEFRGIAGARPITPDELSTAQNYETLKLPGSWETDGAVLNSISEITRFGLPDDYFATYPEKVRALTLADVSKAAESVVHPDRLVWVVVGDRAKIEPGLKELGWGEIHLLDADGKPVN